MQLAKILEVGRPGNASLLVARVLFLSPIESPLGLVYMCTS